MKAVVIFNLGGPDRLESVKPFLFNLFYDRAILNIPNPWRFFLAKLVSSRRDKTAQGIYKHLGGGSPILTETNAQAKALENALGKGYRVFTAMRYWHPMVDEVIEEITHLNPSEVILVPLYPQFSFATTGSFFTEWDAAMKKRGCNLPARKICCYPMQKDFIAAFHDVISSTIRQENIPENARYLFSAHGLPKKNILNGDPYEHHVTLSVNAILKSASQIKDHVICYQSKVGPLEWLGPSTEDEIKRAAADNTPVVIVPVSFVSENSETLYELDYLYKEYAMKLGLKHYFRVPTLQYNHNYITCLASLIKTEEIKFCNQQVCPLKQFSCAA